MPTFVIAGASLAGAKAAETLRDEGFDGEIVLLGTEPELPYERPPLSKGYLLGNDERDSVYVHPLDWYPGHDVDLRLAVTVTAIDRAASAVVTSDDSTLPYDKLLLTTGASPRRLTFPGSDRDEVLYLRTVADSDRLRAAFQPGTRVVVAGAWLDRPGDRRGRPHSRLPCYRARAAARRAARPARARARHHLRRPAPRPRRGVPLRRAGGGVPPRPGHHLGRRRSARRPARGRHRRGPERPAGRRRGTRSRQRRAHR